MTKETFIFIDLYLLIANIQYFEGFVFHKNKRHVINLSAAYYFNLLFHVNACSISAIKSSTFSKPTEIRSKLSVIPAANRASGV